MQNCPSCGNSIPDDVSVCPHCSYEGEPSEVILKLSDTLRLTPIGAIEKTPDDSNKSDDVMSDEIYLSQIRKRRNLIFTISAILLFLLLVTVITMFIMNSTKNKFDDDFISYSYIFSSHSADRGDGSEISSESDGKDGNKKPVNTKPSNSEDESSSDGQNESSNPADKDSSENEAASSEESESGSSESSFESSSSSEENSESESDSSSEQSSEPEPDSSEPESESSSQGGFIPPED